MYFLRVVNCGLLRGRTWLVLPTRRFGWWSCGARFVVSRAAGNSGLAFVVKFRWRSSLGRAVCCWLIRRYPLSRRRRFWQREGGS